MVAINQIISFPQRLFRQNERVVERKATTNRVRPNRSIQSAKIEVAYTNDPESVCIVRIDGHLNVHSYENLIEQLVAAHKSGIRNVVVDLSKVQKIELSGQFALHYVAALFHGQTLPKPNGMRTLRQLAESNIESGPIEGVKLVTDNEQMTASLKKAGLDRVFPLVDNLGTAIQAVQ